MGQFNSDDYYIYYCGQESLKRNGVAIIVNKRVWNAAPGCNLKNDWMVSVHFQGKSFNIMVIQAYAPTSNAEEAEVERLYEDLWDPLELTPKKDAPFIIGDWNAKVGNQKTPIVTGKFGLGVENEAGQRLIGFCQENALVIEITLSQQHKRRLYTWISPDGQYQNQIDYILCSQKWKSSILSAKIRPGADCGSDHELFVAKFKLKLKKVGKTTKPFRYDLYQIPYDYTVALWNRFKGLDLTDRVLDELWMEICDILQETGIKTIPNKKKCKKVKWLSKEAIQRAGNRREAKSREKERYTHLNAEFQRIARRDKKAFLSNQCKETEENNRMRKTRDLFKKMRDAKGTFHAKIGSIKDRNARDLTEAEDIKKRWQEYTEELYKKDLHDPNNQEGVITHLEPDILEWDVKWALGSITMSKASGGDGIPVELFQILKDDVVKVLHSICK